MELDKEVSQGRAAEALLEQLEPFFEMVRAAIIAKWESCPIRDKEGQNELKLMLKLLGDVKANMKHAIDSGKLASVQIERERLLDRFRKN